MKLQRPSPYRALILIVLLAILAVTLIVLDRSGRLSPLRSQAEAFLAPVTTRLVKFGISAGQIGQTQDPQARIKALEEENSRLQAENIKAQALLQENAELRKQLRLEQDQPWKLYGANVLAHSPDPGRHLLTLAAGSKQGIQPGMAVIGQDGSSPPSLIGVVTETRDESATVMLINDFNSAISARVYRDGRPYDGLLQGQIQSGAELQLLQIDRTIQLRAGDTVVTAGLTAAIAPELPNAAIPYNIPIGAISSARIEGNSQIALVRPFVDPDGISYAWVLISTEE